MLAKILIIEDDIDSAELVRFQLEQAGYDVFFASDGTDGLRQTYTRQPDLILLDVMLPTMSGWTVCERLRQITEVPIIFITVLDQEKNIVHGLRLGADDYVVKPYNNRELLARIEAALRRQAMQDDSTPDTFFYDDLLVDFNRRVVALGDEIIHLTPVEFKLLACLAEQPGKTLAHDYLLRRVWGTDRRSRSSLKLYILYLRRKLEHDPTHPKIILTEYGVGYRLNHPR